MTARTGDVSAAEFNASQAAINEPCKLEWWNNARNEWQHVEPCRNASDGAAMAFLWAGGNRSRNYRVTDGGAVVWRGRNQFGDVRP